MKTAVKFGLGMAVITVATMFAISCGGGESKNSPSEKEAADIPDSTEKEVAKNPNEKIVQASGWPDNKYTRQLPKPDIRAGVSKTVTHGFFIVFSVNFIDVTIENIKTYAEQLRNFGYTVNQEETVPDSEMYMFSAENEAGYIVVLSWSGSRSKILISEIMKDAKQ